MYGQYPGNPQFTSFPAMQNRLATLEAQYNNQQYQAFNNRPQMPSCLKGHMVTSIDEAKAAPFDLDGSITFFPSLAENRIYAKTLDNNGLPAFLQFVIQQDPQPKQIVGNNCVMEDLIKRIERLEKELGYDPNGTDASNAKQ